MKISDEEKKELKWLNSKGHSAIKVKCACCGRQHEAVVENVRKKQALKNDTFFCENCVRNSEDKITKIMKEESKRGEHEKK